MKIYKYLNPPVENFIISTILISGGLFRIFEKCTMVEIMYKYYTVIHMWYHYKPCRWSLYWKIFHSGDQEFYPHHKNCIKLWLRPFLNRCIFYSYSSVVGFEEQLTSPSPSPSPKFKENIIKETFKVSELMVMLSNSKGQITNSWTCPWRRRVWF